MSCRTFFETNVENNQICKTLQEQSLDKQLMWEKETASEHSPGPVTNEEQVVRYWLNPVHYDPNTGALKATAFDNASTFGLSVNRMKYVSLDKIKDMAQDYVAQRATNTPPKLSTLIGYSEFSVAEVRSVRVQEPPPGSRAFGVYDTALAHDKSHADICQIATNAQGGRSARSQMRDLANSRLKRFW